MDAIVGIRIITGIRNEDTTFENDRRYNWRKPKTTRFTQVRDDASRHYAYYNTTLTRWDHNRVYRCGEET